ncbi:hypothetical protein K490DRAFT_56651 [Saccharata proteae CBS 121410]|uniref:Uncharacterized protein n=1 Tax=Saccharata proteae CBS 121410 TaxID=1314787 RepID=A0A9P4HVG8_9PEZI|nr:hypothetical protein K490DRAFT_56651 [Saccharata proteae CBS 121410]
MLLNSSGGMALGRRARAAMKPKLLRRYQAASIIVSRAASLSSGDGAYQLERHFVASRGLSDDLDDNALATDKTTALPRFHHANSPCSFFLKRPASPSLSACALTETSSLLSAFDQADHWCEKQIIARSPSRRIRVFAATKRTIGYTFKKADWWDIIQTYSALQLMGLPLVNDIVVAWDFGMEGRGHAAVEDWGRPRWRVGGGLAFGTSGGHGGAGPCGGLGVVQLWFWEDMEGRGHVHWTFSPQKPLSLPTPVLLVLLTDTIPRNLEKLAAFGTSGGHGGEVDNVAEQDLVFREDMEGWGHVHWTPSGNQLSLPHSLLEPRKKKQEQEPRPNSFSRRDHLSDLGS